MILVDTGAELSVAPRGFAAQVQLDPLEGTELRTADGRAIKTFGRKTVELTTLGFSFTMPFVIADVESPLLGFSSLIEQNLCLQMDCQLGHSLVNTHGEKTQLQQRGHQLFLAAWLSPLAVNSSLVGFVFSSFSLGLSEHKEVHKTGGADLGSFTSDNLEHLRQHKNQPAIGQQTALPEDWRTQKKQCKTKVGNKLRNKKQLEYMEKMQLDLRDPTRSLEQQTSRDLSLRVILTLSLMHRWQLSTARFQTACLQHLRNGPLKELGLIQSKTSFEIFVGEELCVMMDGPSLLIGGEQSVQESFLAKLSARYPLDNTRKLEQNTPLTFLGRILEYSQADRSISLSLPRAFYAELLERYSLEDATTRATPQQLVHQAPSWAHASLDASKTKLYTKIVGELSGASLLRPDIAYAVQNLSLSLQHPTTKEEDALKNLLRYLKGTQQYRVSLQPPRRWKQRGHLELLAFSSISWHRRACGFIMGSCLSLLGVHLAAFTTSQATSMTKAEFDSVSLACTLALHTQNLLKELGLTKPVSLRLLTGGSLARQLGLSNRNRHVELSCRFGKFQPSRARLNQNLADELTKHLSIGGLHRLLSKLGLHTQTVEMQALTTELSREQLASFQSSVSSFYIGVVSLTPMMPQQLDLAELERIAFRQQLDLAELERIDLAHLDRLDLAQLELAMPQLDAHQLELETPASHTSLTQLTEERACKDSRKHLPDEGSRALACRRKHQPDEGSRALACCRLLLGEESEKHLVIPQLEYVILSASLFFSFITAIYSASGDRELVEKNFLQLDLRELELQQHHATQLDLRELELQKDNAKQLNLGELEIEKNNDQQLDLGELELEMNNDKTRTFQDRELAENELKTCHWEQENEKQEELQILLWAQELEKYCAELTNTFEVKKSKLHSQLSKLELAKLQFHIRSLDKSSSISGDWTKAVPYPELGQEQFHHKNFQSLIFKKKLVALMLEEHFALAASSQLLGNEAWEEQREASQEISFDKVGDKELHQELRRAEPDCKDLRSDSFRALCPSSFEENFSENSLGASSFQENSFAEETFADTSFAEETFSRSSLTRSSLTTSSLTQSSLTRSSFTESSLTKQSFDKNSFLENPFLKNNFSKKSFDKSSLGESSLGDSSLETSSLAPSSSAQSSLAHSSLTEETFSDNSFEKDTFSDSSFEESSFTKSSFRTSSFRGSSFDKKSSLQQSSLEKSSLQESSLERSSFESRLVESSFSKSSFPEPGFHKSSFEDRSFHKSSFEDSSFHKNSFEHSSLEESSLEAESLPGLSPTLPSELAKPGRQPWATELSAALRTAFPTELLQLAHSALHTELAELQQETFKEVSLLCFREGSFSLLPCGPKLLTAWPQGGVLRAQLLPLTLPEKSPEKSN